ncbi:MAG: Asp-tRNA(Asn)/Glu-tRNA(Gln) amidotransferase subunit GatC [Candidatus Aenigmatarchaeota archaeon]
MGEVDIEQVARIARIKLTEAEIKGFGKDLEEVKKIFDQIDEIEVDEEPAFQPLEVKNRMRSDKAGKRFSKDEAFSNTEHKEGGFFKGPKV